MNNEAIKVNTSDTTIVKPENINNIFNISESILFYFKMNKYVIYAIRSIGIGRTSIAICIQNE